MDLFGMEDETAAELAERHGTPAFIYSRQRAETQARSLLAHLPPRVRLAYAVKANPFPDLLRTFASLGLSFDCASLGELGLIQELGLPPGRVFFAGPGKRREELALALKMGVRIQAESWEDLAQADDLATAPVKVNLRVHPRQGAEETSRIIGGVGPSAFGVDEEQVPEILARAQTLARVRIEGLHVFAASNQRDARQLLGTHGMVLDLAQRLNEVHGLELCQIDLGGGLGVPYAAGQAELDLAAFGQGLADLLAAHPWFQGELILEPGRFLAAPCGVYLVRVVRIKESRGTRFAVLEGGINHLLRPLLTGEPFPVKAIRKSGATATFTLAGPLCTSLDRLGEATLQKTLAAGDLLAFGMTGAYGRSEGMTHFLSHPVPPEIWVN
jgi:diaminopimelate decarboxylase